MIINKLILNRFFLFHNFLCLSIDRCHQQRDRPLENNELSTEKIGEDSTCCAFAATPRL